MMPMHPQHTTTRRAPRAAQTHSCTITCTADDVIEAIRRISARQDSVFVFIAHLRVDLGLLEEDLPWLRQTLHELDNSGQICLGCYEKPQDLALYIASWFVPNALGVHCHEVCINPDAPPRTRIASLMRKHKPWPRSPELCLGNPAVREQRITQLVKTAAETLQSMGRTGTGNPRLAKLFTSTGRAA